MSHKPLVILYFDAERPVSWLFFLHWKRQDHVHVTMWACTCLECFPLLAFSFNVQSAGYMQILSLGVASWQRGFLLVVWLHGTTVRAALKPHCRVKLALPWGRTWGQSLHIRRGVISRPAIPCKKASPYIRINTVLHQK